MTKQTEIHNNALFNTVLNLDRQVLKSVENKMGNNFSLNLLKEKLEDKIRRNNGDDKHILPANKLLMKHATNIQLGFNGEFWCDKHHMTLDNVDGHFDIINLREAEKQCGWKVSNHSEDGKKVIQMIETIAEIELLNLLEFGKDSQHPAEIAFDLLINEFGLNDQNGYVDLDNEIVLEASNNAIISLELDQFDENSTVEEILDAVATQLLEFDAEEEFNYIWSPEFGERNGFTVFEFVEMLEADQEQFEQVSADIVFYVNGKK